MIVRRTFYLMKPKIGNGESVLHSKFVMGIVR